MSPRWAAAVMVGMAAVGATACNDSESVGDALERIEREDQSETTTTAASALDAEDVDVNVPAGGFRFESADPFSIDGEVEDPNHYRLTATVGTLVTEAIVVDDSAFVRDARAETIATERYDQVPVDDYESAEVLEELDDMADEGGEVAADDVTGAAFDASLELATLDPASFHEVILAGGNAAADEVEDGFRVSTREFVMPLAAELYAETEGVDPIRAALVVDKDGVPLSAVVAADIGGAPYRSEVTYDFGPVDPVVAPPTDQLDPTPDVDEEELLAFTDTPLVAPATPPVGLALRSVFVVPTEQTLEGCSQVQLEYGDELGADSLVVFLLPQACAEAFDDTPFDQTYGGLPSRFDGYEVLVGTTVAQLTGNLREPEYEAVAADLQPTTPEALIAGVVPRPG